VESELKKVAKTCEKVVKSCQKVVKKLQKLVKLFMPVGLIPNMTIFEEKKRGGA